MLGPSDMLHAGWAPWGSREQGRRKKITSADLGISEEHEIRTRDKWEVWWTKRKGLLVKSGCGRVSQSAVRE